MLHKEIDNNLIFFETSQMTERFSLGCELNLMPLTFWVSALTARPPMHLSVTVPPPTRYMQDRCNFSMWKLNWDNGATAALCITHY